jgi:branched-chain amino acid transport system substrate-binding protein
MFGIGSVDGKLRNMVLVLLGLLALTTQSSAQEQQPFRLGIVTFLSGGAAGPFGIPANNAANLVIDAINRGEVPAPYDSPGLAGAAITPLVIDEAGGATQQANELRNLVERQNVDAVIGYISSGDCLAIAPVAEELRVLTIMFDCGTPRIFEDDNYTYVFRTGPTATSDSVAAARYVLENFPEVATVAGINQNYAWGQDSWSDFAAAMRALKPEIRVAAELFPTLYAGQYGAEISRLLVQNPDVIHSSHWGGDMEALILQGAARGLFDDRVAVFTTAETAMYRLSRQLPERLVLGARGTFGVYAPDTKLNHWFRDAYRSTYGTPPTYPSYKMAQALLGLKAAVERAAEASGGERPSTEQIIEAFEGLEFEGPGGPVTMSLGNGHQAVMSTAYGTYRFDGDSGEPIVENVAYYPPECVNPPQGTSSGDWISQGMPGAECE